MLQVRNSNTSFKSRTNSKYNSKHKVQDIMTDNYKSSEYKTSSSEDDKMNPDYWQMNEEFFELPVNVR